MMRGAPWALPAGLLAILAASIATPFVARALEIRRVYVWCFLCSVGVFLAATVTPSPTAGSWAHAPLINLRLALPRIYDLKSLNDESVNVFLCVPLGFFALLLARASRRFWPLLVAIALPFFAEAIQILPVLDRIGFQLPDVISNLCGLVGGSVLAGTLLTGSWLIRGHRP
jgi:glycopeptide antibiotics resistance protein